MIEADYGFWPGRYPAIVKTYDPITRTCRIEIPGLTDGGDVLPNAEIEYPIGDKTRAGIHGTEIEIVPGDTVWISFIGGDSRYPIITGWRNPEAGNGVDWRRWHHKNVEILADLLMNFIAGKNALLQAGENITVVSGEATLMQAGGTFTITAGDDVLIESASQVTIKAPSVTLNTPQTTCTGKLTVQGLLTSNGGMKGKPGSGGGSAASLDGNFDVTGNMTATGSITDGGGNTPNHSHGG